MPATNGHSNGHSRRGGKPHPLRGQIIALTKQGLAGKVIAEKLGLNGKPGRILVANIRYKARKDGELPGVSR
jgi:hypothetical protein